MKRRNYLLALILLALFVASGYIYFRAFVLSKPFGIVIFVGEGLVSSKLTAARLYDGGADRRLAIGSLPNLALISTHAADFAVPDAASAASALACGAKVNHRSLCIDPSGKARATLLELAREAGRATGLVTNGDLTDPTPAAFYAHADDCRDRDSLAAQLVDHAGLDVILGGGAVNFLPASAGGRRRDSRNLAREMADQHYTLPRTAGDLDSVEAYGSRGLFGLFSPEAFAFRDSLPAASTEPTLPAMVRTAIEMLQRHAGGYLLVVDAGLIERASLANNGEHALKELLELDQAVSVALQYAGTKTLVLVAGGEATGGMALNGYPLHGDHGVSLLGMNAEGLPSITWATGPGGTAPEDASASPPIEPAAFFSPYAANVADDAIAGGFGPGSEQVRGFQDNTFLFGLVRSEL